MKKSRLLFPALRREPRRKGRGTRKNPFFCRGISTAVISKSSSTSKPGVSMEICISLTGAGESQRILQSTALGNPTHITILVMRKKRQRRERQAEEKRKTVICKKCGNPAIYERVWKIGSDSKIKLAVHCTDCGCCMWCCSSFWRATSWVPACQGLGAGWLPLGSLGIRSPGRFVWGAAKEERNVRFAVCVCNAISNEETGLMTRFALPAVGQEERILNIDLTGHKSLRTACANAP